MTFQSGQFNSVLFFEKQEKAARPSGQRAELVKCNPAIPALETRSAGPFVERPGNFSVPESCFMFPGFAFKIKASIILKMVKWN